jgi:chemotaxis regulatin CheY-phosphate phosphatase CheZ
MTGPPSALDADYETILNAVLETARGRAFLAEHTRRNRQADTKLVLQAIEQLERSLRERPGASRAERMRVDLLDMANAIARARMEIAAIKPAEDREGTIAIATDELDAIVGATEKATSAILAAVERIQEIAWALREQGVDPAVCDILDKEATEAYTACSFQDLTGQRIRRIVNVMRFLEARIDAMIDILRVSERDTPDAEAESEGLFLHGPSRPGEGLTQIEIDDLIAIDRGDDVYWRETEPAASGHEIADEAAVEVAIETAATTLTAPPAPLAAPKMAASPAAAAPSKLSTRLREAIEALSPAERMALFS